ncbi:MAG: mechanosensitive ion channel [Caldilineaceae bacterium]|nr:mechanosensitive ion channel [Caldilineaceae bacterium]
MSAWISTLTLALTYIAIGLIAVRFLPAIVGNVVVSAADARTSAGLNERRRTTLLGLAGHLTRVLISVICTVLILALFVNTAGLLTFLGLFSAAFGLSAGRLVNDYVSGVVFLFEDLFSVGEKVEVYNIEGTVIDVNLRTTVLRAPSGEVYIIPNGEVRVVRNFGRGEFSLATVRVSIRNTQLERAMALLEELAPALLNQIPELSETPTVLSEDGTLSDRVTLTIFAKAHFSQGVKARRKLLRIVQEALTQAEIDINAPK